MDSKTTLLVLTSHLLQWLHHVYAPFFTRVFLGSISRDPFRRDWFPSWTIWAYIVICHYLHWKMYIFLCIQKLDMEIEFKAFQTRYRKREGVWMTVWPMLGLHWCSLLSPSFFVSIMCMIKSSHQWRIENLKESNDNERAKSSSNFLLGKLTSCQRTLVTGTCQLPDFFHVQNT